jgi:uncharacterized protein YjbI with pentapeptide repeats
MIFITSALLSALNSAILKTTKVAAVRIHFGIASICLLLVLIGGGMNAQAAFADQYDKEILAGADFSGKSLQGSQFNKTDLHDALFVKSDLRGVSLFGANMTGANFTSADLRYSTLDTARLNEANLSYALFEGAFVYGASFDGAIIEGADFTDVDFRKNVRTKLCKVANGKNPITGRLTRETLECDL